MSVSSLGFRRHLANRFFRDFRGCDQIRSDQQDRIDELLDRFLICFRDVKLTKGRRINGFVFAA